MVAQYGDQVCLLHTSMDSHGQREKKGLNSKEYTDNLRTKTKQDKQKTKFQEFSN